MRSIVNPRLRSRLLAFYPSLCTIQRRDQGSSPTIHKPSGQLKNLWVDVPGMVDLPCRFAPLILIRPANSEERTVQVSRQSSQFQVTIFGYFPSMDSSMRAVVDKVVFDILGVEFDGSKIFTRIRVEKRVP